MKTNRSSSFAAAALACALGAGTAQAFELDTGNPDLTVRWDNTPRVNLGMRTEKRNDLIGNNQLYDEGTYSFDRGDLVAGRLDWFSELDVAFQKRYGARISAQAWYDGAYGTYGRSNPAFAGIASYVDNKFSDYTRDLYRGPDAEFLDAFVYGRFDLGETPLTVKLGRHTLYWGESLFVNGNLNSIAYAQNPLDLQKGFATPGAEAKELFRPLNQISAQAAVTDELTLMAQYYFEWDSFRFPEGGTFLGPVDFAFRGPQRQFLGPLGFATNGGNINPDEMGDWGIGARWSPQWLDGTLGFYYRNYSDKLPQVLLTRVGPGTSQYNLVYGDNISLYGISLAKNIGGVSVGAELSYRHNTPLNAQVLGNASAAGMLPGGETAGPRGNTANGLVNVLGVIPQDRAVRCRHLGHRTGVGAPGVGEERRQPVQWRGLCPMPVRGQRWRAYARLEQVGRLHHHQLRRHVGRVHADLVPGVPRRGPVGAAGRLRRPVRQRADRLRRQPGQRQLQHRAGRRRVPEVPLRPEVHRLLRPPQGQRRRHCGRHPERLHLAAEGPRFGVPDLQDHFLIHLQDWRQR